MKHHINSQERKNEAIRDMLNLPIDGSYSVEIKKLPKTRTPKQNRTIWKWFTYIADHFNDVGQTVRMGILEIQPMWDKDFVCDLLFRPLLFIITGKKTTVTTIDNLATCIDHMSQGLESMGHQLAVPSKEQLRTGQ